MQLHNLLFDPFLSSAFVPSTSNQLKKFLFIFEFLINFWCVRLAGFQSCSYMIFLALRNYSYLTLFPGVWNLPQKFHSNLICTIFLINFHITKRFFTKMPCSEQSTLTHHNYNLALSLKKVLTSWALFQEPLLFCLWRNKERTGRKTKKYKKREKVK